MAEQRPHILLITTDQQRWDTIGDAKPPFMQTPHLDRLIHQGVWFRRAYADTPVCVPARMGIMSGKLSHGHGCSGNGPSSQFIGHDDTLPHYLGELGYETVAIGKMHFNPTRCHHGFQTFIHALDYYDQMKAEGLNPLAHGLGQTERYATMGTVPEHKTLTSWTAERARHFIERQRDPTRPLFMWASFSKPHPPLDPPEPYWSMYQHCDLPEPVIGDWVGTDDEPITIRRDREQWHHDLVTAPQHRRSWAAYLGLITQIDQNMGRIFSGLLNAGMLGNTLIIFASDHGDYFGSHGCYGKGFALESSARVPMVMRLPKQWEQTHAGEPCDHLVTHADILPTCLAAAGGQAPADLQGVNLLDLVGRDAPPREQLPFVFGPSDQLRQVALLRGRHKYLYFPEGGKELLFDVEADPQDERNLAAAPDLQNVRRDMRRRTVQHFRDAWPHVVDGDDLAVWDEQSDTTAARRASIYDSFLSESTETDCLH